MKNQKKYGVFSAVGAYALWGLLPVYWKLVAEVPAYEILAHRIFWSFIFMLGVIVVSRRQNQCCQEIRQVFADRKRLLGVAAGAVLITVNWFVYIWAVNSNRVIESSLGYYINPLVNVLLGILVLKERMSFWQMVSVLLAALGVLNMTVHFGAVPWVSLSLAISFGLYGLCKKMAGITAVTGITLETLLIMPLAGLYLLYLQQQGAAAGFSSVLSGGILVGAGIVTATPLLLFAYGANHLSLIVLGLIQYLSPTIALLLGIFLYHEPFTQAHLISFAFIWSALLVFSLSRTGPFIQAEAFLFKKRCTE